MKFFSAFESLEPYPKEKFMPHAVPFWLHGKSNEAIVICLHGHGATTYESRPIGDILFHHGFDCAGPLFPAHGLKDLKTAQKEMGSVRKEDWLAHTRQEIQKARSLYSHVYIYGQSMGGAIALLMAAEGLVDGCAVTAPAIKLPNIAKITSVLGWLNWNMTLDLSHEPIFNEVYAFRNMKESKQLYKLSLLARKNLPKITCPVLVCHSHQDQTIDPVVVDWISTRVKGPVEAVWFDRSGHSMPLDVEAEKIGDQIGSFFQVCLNDTL